MALDPNSLIAAMNAMPPAAVWAVMLAACFSGVIVMLRLFGEAGLYVYIAVAIIGANVQVLKAVQFGIYAEPVALGTILFSTTYLCTDILAEHYGPASARRGVMVGFASYLLWVVFMLITLGFRPMTPEQAGEAMAWALPYHDHMAALFTPAPAFFVAGMTAYLISQHHDVWLFGILRRATGGRYLWLRNNASTMVSAFIDNVIFSLLAWVVFAPQPVGWHALIFTYILGAYGLRVLVALLDTPFMYLAGRAVPRPVAA